MCAWMIDTYGRVEQKEEWIPQMAGMDKLASYCLTEPGKSQTRESPIKRDFPVLKIEPMYQFLQQLIITISTLMILFKQQTKS
jgi:hypothetical protein